MPEDLKHFKQITSGHTVMMGERTYLSLPKHPLPNRRNIVLTDVQGKTFEGVEMAYSLDEMQALVQPDEEAFVIGGGMVYRQMMPRADKLYITHIHHSWEDADTFFPEIKDTEWVLKSAERHSADEHNPYDYTFAEYIKRSEGDKE
jgi:dihydrofolate reductase